ncbi:ribonuclease Z [Candidatus Woesearchaeota archaeon]|nr:ribonuclease Z [Candidatus Woesearchaeota archaeon]MBW3021797.1 ribonuclease Z [Candidatus Woesearchaeota archaeon]
MEIMFLGTSCTQPTKDRSHPAILLTYKGEHILMDCGEGTQRQLKIAGVKPAKITKLLISHWHGDHVLGIPGLIQTMGMSEYSKKLLIFGPKGSKEHMGYMLKAFESRGSIDFDVTDLKEGIFYECEDYYLESFVLNHKPLSRGYRFVEKPKRRIDVKKIKKLGMREGPLLGNLQKGMDVIFKGKKIKAEDVTYEVKGKIVAYIGDTGMCNNCVKIAEDADLLISESTFLDKDRDKAEDRLHLTAKEAGLIANRGNAKKLVLTHFSLRYKDSQEIEEEARTYFDNVFCANDFMRFKV